MILKKNSALEKQSELQMRMSKLGKNLVGFLDIRAETNLITAVGITVVLLIEGIDFAILFGVLIYPLPWSSSSFYSTHNAWAVQIWANRCSWSNCRCRGYRYACRKRRIPFTCRKRTEIISCLLISYPHLLELCTGNNRCDLSIPLTIVLKLLLESFEDTKWLT